MTGTLNSLKNAGLVAVWLVIAVLAMTAMLRQCSSPDVVRTVIARDTIRTKPDSVIVLRERIQPVYLKSVSRDTIRDTTLRILIAERETKREQLDSNGISELLVLDTTAQLPLECSGERFSLSLRLTDTCDCIQRSIKTVIRTSDTMLILTKHESLPSYALGFGLSAGLTSDGRLVASLALSVTRVLAFF